MSLSPVAFIAPNYRDYKGWWLKFYSAGTTTPKTIILNSGGTTSSASKLQLNKDGFITSSGGTIVVPYITGAYDAYLFPTAAEADANNTAQAVRVADGLTNELASSVVVFDNVAEMKAASLNIGQAAMCKRYYANGDLVDGLVYEIQAARAVDGYANHTLNNGNVAVLIKEDVTFYRASQFGLGDNLTETENSQRMQYYIDNFGGFTLDVNATYNQALVLPFDGGKIIGVGSEPILTWNGPDETYGIVTTDTRGSYQNYLFGFTLLGATNQKYGLDAYRMRFSSFERVKIRKMKIGARSVSNWNNNWKRCWFNNESQDVGSIGIYFEYLATETFNITNAALFQRCLFNTNERGIVFEGIGDATTFQSCGVEANSGYGITFQGQGVCHSLTFQGNYIELNELGPILFNKTLAGSLFGVVFQNNYIGMDATARAGLIEFVASNGTNHSLKFSNNTFRDFSGTPTSGNLLDVNGAVMSNIYIEWFNNTFGSTLGSTVAPFNRNAVDWRYMKTDVVVQLAYIENPTTLTDFEPAYQGGEITVSVTDFGQARIQGTFKNTGNVSVVPLNITEAMPITLRPQAFEQIPAFKITTSNLEGTPTTVMINGGQVRGINIEGSSISFSRDYQLQRNRPVSV